MAPALVLAKLCINPEDESRGWVTTLPETLVHSPFMAQKGDLSNLLLPSMTSPDVSFSSTPGHTTLVQHELETESRVFSALAPEKVGGCQ